MTRTANRVLLLILIVATIGCDRVSKRFATEFISDSPSQSFLNDLVRLDYAENPGAFLGLGADWPAWARTAVFTLGNGLLLVAMAVASVRARWSAATQIGLALFVAGGASNMVDRLMRGTVVDFLNLGIGPVRTGIFNVADVAILLGAALVLFGSTRSTLPSSPSSAA
jgi:signal peptidase II